MAYVDSAVPSGQPPGTDEPGIDVLSILDQEREVIDVVQTTELAQVLVATTPGTAMTPVVAGLVEQVGRRNVHHIPHHHLEPVERAAAWGRPAFDADLTDGRVDFVSRRGAENATVGALVDDGRSAARSRDDGRHHPYTARMADSPTVWCPSCGAEYVAGSLQCADCRVALVSDQPAGLANGGPLDDENLVELGAFPRLAAQILRRRLETAGITVMVEWTSASGDASGTLIVPEAQADFAEAVVNEIDVDDEVPDTSPVAYVTRIEEHLAAAAGLLEELRTRLEQDELEG
jgi:hypothetical protein